ncbi:hypothetical protein EGR_06803 [Echinococcus granulosus]|uniref:Uncharacterized protein n=1 Tax=Echinococcus granulosus TaxID=6210 RepID=W6UCF4_ECHGR|nr:hypothetical protein EGR_06803 [Echinococcus granulosus]EUB58396.1 hypothetical protein EGR_06803 [Echinococcus granulosus]
MSFFTPTCKHHFCQCLLVGELQHWRNSNQTTPGTMTSTTSSLLFHGCEQAVATKCLSTRRLLARRRTHRMLHSPLFIALRSPLTSWRSFAHIEFVHQ